MTRLTASDIESVADRLDEYDADLRRSLGHGLATLALTAAGLVERPNVVEEMRDIGLAAEVYWADRIEELIKPSEG